jgi:hypothetical protein
MKVCNIFLRDVDQVAAKEVDCGNVIAPLFASSEVVPLIDLDGENTYRRVSVDPRESARDSELKSVKCVEPSRLSVSVARILSNQYRIPHSASRGESAELRSYPWEVTKQRGRIDPVRVARTASQ